MLSYPFGGMAERLNAVVLKTIVLETAPGVRIPLPPLLFYGLGGQARIGFRAFTVHCSENCRDSLSLGSLLLYFRNLSFRVKQFRRRIDSVW
jgi:hypothetical protein